MEHVNDHAAIDEFKRRLAKAVLAQADLPAIRQRSLANLDRWTANGVWCSAFDEWRTIMTTGSDAEVIAAMTGTDQNANRLRQSAPYSGFLDDEARSHLWATRDQKED